jgi:FOG: HEAT repeat
MKNIFMFAAISLFLVALPVVAQVPVGTQVAILKAEDSRDHGALTPFIVSKNLAVQKRAVLAAGRIGSAASVEALANVLANGDESVRSMAAFALGETEADSAAPYLLGPMGDVKAAVAIRVRAVEAAGKIAAANREGAQSKALGAAVVAVLKQEHGKRSGPYTDLIRAAITAVLRVRPEGGAEAVAPFLTYSDQALIADALNTLSRLRYKGANEKTRELMVQGTSARRCGQTPLACLVRPRTRNRSTYCSKLFWPTAIRVSAFQQSVRSRR